MLLFFKHQYLLLGWSGHWGQDISYLSGDTYIHTHILYIFIYYIFICIIYFYILYIFHVYIFALLVTQLCLTFYDPLDCSLLGSSVQRIFQQKYWSGLPFPTPGDLSDPGIEPTSPVSPALHSDS